MEVGGILFDAAAVELRRLPELAAIEADPRQGVAHLRVLRAQRQGAPRRVLRLPRRALLPAQHREVVLRLGKLRMLADQGPQHRPGFVRAPPLLEHHGQIEARRHVTGPERQGPAEGALRLLPVAAIEARAAEAVPGRDVARLPREHLPVTGRRGLGVFEVLMHGPELVARIGETGLDPERFEKAARAPGRSPRALSTRPRLSRIPGAAGAEGHGALERFARAREVAPLVEEQAEVLEGEGVAPPPREKAAVGPFGGLEAPGPMQRDGLVQHPFLGGVLLRTGVDT